jgi:dihydrofolate reductase
MEPLGHLHHEPEISLASGAQVGQPVRRAPELARQCCPGTVVDVGDTTLNTGQWTCRCRCDAATCSPRPAGGTHVGKLIYAANTSLDGYLEDETGSFDWSVPDEEVHAFWNEHERHIGTSLYGRRMYETMRVWESDDWLTTEPPIVREYAGIWRDADKVVYSTTLEAVSTARTRIERRFEPDAVRRLKEASSSDLSIGGAAIGAEAFRHGLVDECVLLLCPVLVGGGKPALPRGVRLDLELLDHRRFGNGVIYLRHAVRNAS